MKLKTILYMLLILPALWSCSDDDNIGDIFVSGKWTVANFFTTTDWTDDHNFKQVYIKGEEVQALKKLTIIFNHDGTFKGTLTDGTYSGKWEANGKDRSVSLTNIQTAGAVTGFSLELINTLKNARFYRGDSNYLKLGPEAKDRYVQFAHY